jgi:hypothetical protein
MNKLDKNILLARASPRRNIKEVEEQVLPCDVLHVNFYQEYTAYQEIKKYFLNTEYEYLVLATDDIVVRPEHIIQLEADLIKYRPKVLGGIMNVEEGDYPNGLMAVSQIYDNQEIHFMLGREVLLSPIIFTVTFNGFCLLAIHRDIIANYEFVGQNHMRDKNAGKADGGSFDMAFCHYCNENNIPIYTDRRIFMKHLRRSGKTRIGEINPSIVLNSNEY